MAVMENRKTNGCLFLKIEKRVLILRKKGSDNVFGLNIQSFKSI